ncbi:DEAD/DEAH box helicase [Oscillatoria sp. CS-180]|uniref:DEAD/DEAH box helicase n=1 Tax=Oscillatoria sp. CS-180 TaxID=3021720 RepID=UPI0023303381|nr:DEAD/DEAH box helicase [Oscillatoria sp. CS-180]MDB9528269.1 DEAD/DEAH box helicase [Oscillatoria sp. CS-180]
MAILHGSWLVESQQFFIWGETWRRVDAERLSTEWTVQDHPFCTALPDLLDGLKAVGGLPKTFWVEATATAAKRRTSTKGNTRQVEQMLSLPTTIAEETYVPHHSAADLSDSSDGVALHPWKVAGVQISDQEAAAFLESLPLGQTEISGVEIGDDLRFWSHVARWSLDLQARGKYLPAIALSPNKKTHGQWRLLLDSDTDSHRLRLFSQTMPLICRLYRSIPKPRKGTVGGVSVSMPAEANAQLCDFLEQLVDAQVRSQAQPVNSTDVLSPDLPLRPWLESLSSHDDELEGSAIAAARLRDALTTWTAPLQSNTEQNRFRVCFQLEPPETDSGSWHLGYYLQSRDDETSLISAETVWQYPVDQAVIDGQVVQTPQETLLAGLGRAARFSDIIRESLQQQRPIRVALDPAQTFVFLKATVERLRDAGFGVLLPPGLASQAQDNRLGIQVQAEAPNRKQRQRLGLKSLLNVEWELSLAGKKLSQKDFEKLVAQETPLIEIDGQWVELRPQDIRTARDFFKRRNDPIELSVEDALRLSTGDTQVIDKLPVVKFEAAGMLQDLISTLTEGNQTLKPVTEPEGFTGKLRPYQARGVSWLSFLEQWGLGACLADDMGLGKTIQLIGFLLTLREQDLLDAPVLLVCPTSVLGNWEREIHKFGPALKVLMHHGDKRSHAAAFARKAKSANIVLTSYALAQRDLKDFERVDWLGIVLDEAQNIKNPDAKQSKAVRQIDAQFRIALTGTPVENRLAELWSIMDFLNPGYLGPKNFFQRRFATPIERYGDTASLSTLRSLVQPFILRRLKTDRTIIQDLPEKLEMTVFCGLSREQAQLYQASVEKAMKSIEAAEGVQRRGQILGLLTKLKQVCNHPAQFLDEEGLVAAGRSGKLSRFDEMVAELLDEGDRALIFTQFAEWGKRLQAHLERIFKQETLFLYGSTSKNKREEMVDRFQHDPSGPRLFILSLKAGGVGLNLTRANHVFHFDRWWNPAVENQATDRAFRIGQTKNVQVHKFVCNGTLEEKIHDMIESKKALSEQVVGAGEQWLTELDTDSLRNLLLLDRDAVIDDGEA